MHTRLLVSGASGFIGSHVTGELLRQGHFVVGVDDLSGGFYENVAPFVAAHPAMFRFYETDVGDRDEMTEIFLAHRPRIVIHCAANAREGASFYDPRAITYANAMISATLLELGILHKMQRFVFFSSMSVYGIGGGKPPFDEKTRRNPVDPYGVSKMAVEMMVEQLASVHGFSYVILRPHNSFGTGQSMSDLYRNAVAIFMNRILRKEPLYLFGEGHSRAFSYIEDSLPCFIRAMLDDSLTGEIVNIGGKEPITIQEMARAVIDEMVGVGAEYEIIQAEPRHGEVPHAFSTYKKSEEMLGYDEKIGWREGVKRMAEWAKRRGPQPWLVSRLPLLTETAPLPWRELPKG